MKMTKQEILSKHFHIVEEDLEVLDQNTWNEFHKVTHSNAVLIGDELFCTELWYSNLMKEIGEEDVG